MPVCTKTLQMAFDACSPEGQEYIVNIAVTVAALMPAVPSRPPKGPSGWEKPEAVEVLRVSGPA